MMALTFKLTRAPCNDGQRGLEILMSARPFTNLCALERHFRWLAFAAFVFWLAAVTVLSLLPFRSISFLTPSLPDIAIHFIAYGIGALFACLSLPRPVLIWAGMTLFGAAVEFGQAWIGTGRSAEFQEGVANGLGALLGVALAMALISGFQWCRQRL
ncbi:MAG: hypothetical protein COW58_06505 [Thalassolituus sp. CG17_big_fil_post_rev_8_21_14_2_50_53_8]|nr:MAG: hypothetical protein COW58_06505 [Thalassolituus sp. CG17_big_fil_post_rev_8_21_14_2_50_53_8]